RIFASGRNLRMTCSFLVRFRSAAVEGAHDAPYHSRCVPPLVPVQGGETGRRQRGQVPRQSPQGSRQFSTRRPGTRENSSMLVVTRVTSSASAWAAISRSLGPI